MLSDMTERSGKVQTVLGLVNPNEVGIVLTHEHLTLDYTQGFISPPPRRKNMVDSDYNLENLGYIRQYPYSHKRNLEYFGSDVEAALLKDLKEYKDFGGGCIVDNTTTGIRRNAPFILQASKDTGLHLIVGTGYYLSKFQTQETLQLSIEQMTDTMVKEVTEGCLDLPEVKCGIIGEVGISWPMHEFEEKSLIAAAIAQQSTGAPVIIHPGRFHKSPFDVMRIFTEAGGDASRTVMSHLDRTISNHEELMDLSSLGCYLEWDFFGIEISHHRKDPSVFLPSDAQRVKIIKKLLNEGLEDRIVIAHDFHTRHRVGEFGGHGFSHILEQVLPKMRIQEYTEEQITKITQTNPQTWLTFK